MKLEEPAAEDVRASGTKAVYTAIATNALVLVTKVSCSPDCSGSGTALFVACHVDVKCFHFHVFARVSCAIFVASHGDDDEHEHNSIDDGVDHVYKDPPGRKHHHGGVVVMVVVAIVLTIIVLVLMA